MSVDAATTVSQRVHDSLRQQILEGELAPGDRIPSERLLAEEFGVNRHAVREALKRLEQASLVRITHGGATRVLDWRDSGGLEVLLDLGGGPVDPPAELIRSVLEMRASIGIDAARICAGRAGAPGRREIAELGERAAALVGSGEDEQLDQAYAEFWLAIVTGSDNIAYRLSLNSLLTALAGFGEVAAQVRPEDAEAINALGQGIGSGDAEAAEAAAARMLRADVERVS